LRYTYCIEIDFGIGSAINQLWKVTLAGAYWSRKALKVSISRHGVTR
jgi:hypothetical protein